jgi:transcriptional regulator with XRE-family HTH domain
VKARSVWFEQSLGPDRSDSFPRYASRVRAGPLGEFLKARRERLKPGDVGLDADSSTRRVSGLRREEVAALSGVSKDYYLRLEQGHSINPSDQVVDALARALRLDDVGTVYLRALAQPADPRSAAMPSDVVSDSMRWLIQSWPLTGAIVHNRFRDVIAANKMARALNPNFRVGVNSVVVLFTDPAERELHADWETLAPMAVAVLRSTTGSHRDNPHLEKLVREGFASSELFRRAWERHEVVVQAEGWQVLQHPTVGELTLRFVSLPLMNTDGQTIFTFQAEPGSLSATAMSVLAAEQ